MLVGDRLVLSSRTTRAPATFYSCELGGGDLRRHTDHDGFYARNPATDGQRIVYHVAGDIWLLDASDAGGEPRALDLSLGSPSAARAPKIITAASHLGELMPDATGQASVVEVRGTVHWLTHADGPARGHLRRPERPCPRSSHPRHRWQGHLDHRR